MNGEQTALIVQPSQEMTFFEAPPTNRVEYGTKIANILSDVITRQRLFSDIQGKRHVTVEGWNVMGCLLGVMPREREVRRLEDGSYEATVDLVNVSTGVVVGGASHLCSIREARWAKADEYARRSMAVTRATGKAYRLGFSWIIKLAGYEPTPDEEMPRAVDASQEAPEKYEAKTWQKQDLVNFARHHGILERDDLIALSKACEGVEMTLLSKAVAEYAQDYLKKEKQG